MDYLLSRQSILLRAMFGVAVSCFLAAGGLTHAADPNLNIVFTTTDAGGEFNNKHVHVVWLANTSGGFISTAGTNVGNNRAVWANKRRDSLDSWWTSARQSDVDARTGATQTSYRTYNINWDFTDLDGVEAPDGDYRLYFECTNSDDGSPRNYTYFAITKGPTAWNTEPTTQGGYNNVSLTYTPASPAAPTVINTGASNVTASSARLNGAVTDNGLEDPEVSIHWGDNDAGAGTWDNTVALGIKGEGAFYTDITGLTNGQTYYYRCRAMNSIGATWSATNSFDAITQLNVTVFQENSLWKYLKGTSTPTNWKTIGYNDNAWLSGPVGIGYGDGDDNTILSDMEDNYITVYMRYHFTVAYPEDARTMTLTTDYDDGFVAYLNSTEVRRRNIAGTPTHTTTASSHDAVVDGGALDIADISNFKSSLVPGDNVFAIEIHNTSIGSSDLTMIPKLEIVSVEHQDQPNIRLNPTGLDFGRRPIGSDTDLTFDIENSGSAVLRVTSLTLSGDDKGAYSLVAPPALPFDVAPVDGNRAITVRFNPTASSAFNNATVDIGSDDPDEPLLSVSLNGRGYRPTAPTWILSLAPAIAPQKIKGHAKVEASSKIVSVSHAGALPSGGD